MRYNGIKLLLVSVESILELIVEGFGCEIKFYFVIKVFNVGLKFYKIIILEGFFGEVLIYNKLIFLFCLIERLGW